jgi:hypothetical protein
MKEADAAFGAQALPSAQTAGAADQGELGAATRPDWEPVHD